jgi:hypothetical protein
MRYRDEGADELVFYDIGASPEGRTVDAGWVERVARVIDIPFCVAGGIRSVDGAHGAACRRGQGFGQHAGAGASGAGLRAGRRVRRAVRGGRHRLDPRRGRRVAGAQPHRRSGADARAGAHARLGGQAQALGAGEIVLNCMGSDGVRAATTSRSCGGARGVRGAAGGFRRRRLRGPFRRSLRMTPTSMQHWRRACSIPARCRSRNSSAGCARAASRCAMPDPRTPPDLDFDPGSLDWAKQDGLCRRSCSTPTACRC